MKKLFVLYIFLLIGAVSFAQKKDSSDNTQDKNKKEETDGKVQSDTDQEKKSGQDQEVSKEDKHTQDTRYHEGSSGVKRSISYKFSNALTDSDPGNGIFRYNKDEITGITYIFLDDIDLSGEDQTKWYSTWDDTTGATGRGRINIVEYEGKNVNVFDVKGVFIEDDGYWKIPVEYVSGSLPADGKTYFYIFERIENKDKTSKEEKKEGESRVEETATVAAVVTAAAVVIEPTPEPQLAPVVEEKKEEPAPAPQPEPVVEEKKEEPVPEPQSEPVAEAKEEPVVQQEPVAEKKEEPVPQPEPVKEESKVEETATVAAVVTAAAVVIEPTPEPQLAPVVEEKKEEPAPAPQPEPVAEAKEEPVVQQEPVAEKKEEPVPQPEPVKEESKVEETVAVAAVVTAAAVVTQPTPEPQPVPVVEEKKEEPAPAPQPEPVKEESKVEETVAVAEVVTAAAVISDPLAKTQESHKKISFKFSSNTSNSNPGEGGFKYDNDLIKNISFLFLNDFDLSGEDQTEWYMQWKKVAGTSGKARINLFEIEGKNVNVLYVKGVFVREKGYWRIQAEYVSGPMPVDGEIYYFELENSQKPAEEAGSENAITTEVSSEVSVISEKAEPVKEERKVEEAAAVAAVVTTVAVAAPQEDPLPAKAVEEKRAGTVPDSQPDPAERVKTELVEQQEPIAVVREEQVSRTEPIKEESKVSEKAAAAAVVTVAAAGPEPKTEQRSRTTQPGQPSAKTEAPRQTQPKQESKPVQPTQQAPASQPKTIPQSTQQPAPVKKETPASQPAPKTNQPAPKPAQPQSRPGQPQTSPATGYPSSGTGSSVNVFTKRSDGSRVFHGIIETGYGFRVSDYGINNYRINFIGSFSLGQHFMIGLGLGYRNYFDKPEKHTDWYLVSGKSQIPVFLDLRYLFTKKKLTPFVALGIGGTTEKSKSDTTSYGSFINPSAGIWYRLSKNTALFADIAYEGIEMEFAKPVDNIPFRRKNNSISLNIGIQF